MHSNMEMLHYTMYFILPVTILFLTLE